MTESAIQAQIYQFWGQSSHRQTTFLFSIPNEGATTPQEGVRLRAMGLRKGMPDLCLMGDGWTVFIEVKTPTGKVRPEQLEVHERIHKTTGVTTVVVRNLEEFQNVLAQYTS
jgi:hypothetical protein